MYFRILRYKSCRVAYYTKTKIVIKNGAYYFNVMIHINELYITSLSRAIKEAQDLLKLYSSNNSLLSVIDEFLEQKYFEASRENKIL